MIVSHRNRLIFVKTRKTAGTSVEIALSKHAGPEDILTRLTREDEFVRAAYGGVGPQNERIPYARWRATELGRLRWKRGPVFYNHMPARRDPADLAQAWDEYLTFSIVRNPWDVAVSAYCWRHPNREITLSEFLASDRLPRLVSWPILADGSGVIVDEVVRYESLREDLEQLSDRTGIESRRSPACEGSQRERIAATYRELMTPSDRDRVAAVFRREIEQFGYEF